MSSRIPLFVAACAAALVLVVGFTFAGMAPGAATTGAPVSVPVAATAPAPPQPVTQVDTVYLTPQATPQVVVTQVVQTQTASGGEHENESGND